MPPRGFRHSHFPLFKTGRWTFEKFASEVATLSLGTPISILSILPSQRRLVLEDISYALQQEKIISCVVLRVKPLDKSEDFDVQFLIERTFWQDEDAVSELSKFLSNEGNLIPYEYFYTLQNEKRLYMDQEFSYPKTERHKLGIANPGQIFSDLIDFETLPDDAWFERYSKYRHPFSWEILAVAWRYVALNESDKGPSISSIVDYLE